MKSNPFSLTFGKSPNELVSRYEYAEEIINTFKSEIPASQAYLIQGIRGSGKTVLMTLVEKELKKDKDWIIVDLNSTQDLLSDLAIRLVDSCKEFTDILKKGFNVSIAGFGVGINGETQSRNSVSIINEILEKIQKKNKRVLITIDEVMNGNSMRNFASEFQIFLRKDFPVFLLMTGLYENIYTIQNDPALTFLLRTPKINLEPLSLLQISKQYQKVFECDTEMANKLAKTTKGYAFAFMSKYGNGLNVRVGHITQREVDTSVKTCHRHGTDSSPLGKILHSAAATTGQNNSDRPHTQSPALSNVRPLSRIPPA